MRKWFWSRWPIHQTCNSGKIYSSMLDTASSGVNGLLTGGDQVEWQRVVQEARAAAEELAVAAGKLAKEAFLQDKEIEAKGEYGDIVTEIDRQAEEWIVSGIKKRFPSHRILGEEFGWQGGNDPDWSWMIDPLDGTNNYAIGLPVYAVCITCFYRNEPVLGVIYDSHLERLYVAVKGEGATVNGKPLTIEPQSFKRPTVAWVQGHHVQGDDRSLALRQALEQRCKRVLRLWAPGIAWSLLAQGQIDAMVVYRSGGVDMYAGMLLAREAGAVTVDYGGKAFEGIDPDASLIACHPEKLTEIIKLVRT
ncbi:inositol monophosphatase family protein [Laceyella sacchari]|uniref:inositol monophosphatase family protein n=1 Tax=Laceyella sacchari TaxID=37482 RepID=UPI001FE90711|nr:inositol monophosphatase family protein [Laceyella sacchari]